MTVNIGCDILASETTAHVEATGAPDDLPPILAPPYEGPRAMLRIGKRWITSHYKRHLYDARCSGPIRSYMKEKYEWDDETFDSVDWATIGQMRRRQTHTQRMHSCKLMHGWLPTMNKNFRYTTTQCPGCACPNETTNHVFVCSNHTMKRKRREIVAALRKKGLRKHVPRSIEKALTEFIAEHFPEASPLGMPHDLPIRKAMAAQRRVGLDMLLRGFIVKEWRDAAKALGVSNPDRTAASILRFLWEDICRPLWDIRNDILHRGRNNAKAAEDSTLAEALLWYSQHKHEVLPAHDHHLADFDAADLHRMPSRVRRARKHRLDTARKAHSIERQQRQSNQTVITRWLLPRVTAPDTSGPTAPAPAP